MEEFSWARLVSVNANVPLEKSICFGERSEGGGGGGGGIARGGWRSTSENKENKVANENKEVDDSCSVGGVCWDIVVVSYRLVVVVVMIG